MLAALPLCAHMKRDSVAPFSPLHSWLSEMSVNVRFFDFGKSEEWLNTPRRFDVGKLEADTLSLWLPGALSAPQQ